MKVIFLVDLERANLGGSSRNRTVSAGFSGQHSPVEFTGGTRHCKPIPKAARTPSLGTRPPGEQAPSPHRAAVATCVRIRTDSGTSQDNECNQSTESKNSHSLFLLLTISRESVFYFHLLTLKGGPS